MIPPREGDPTPDLHPHSHPNMHPHLHPDSNSDPDDEMLTPEQPSTDERMTMSTDSRIDQRRTP